MARSEQVQQRVYRVRNRSGRPGLNESSLLLTLAEDPVRYDSVDDDEAEDALEGNGMEGTRMDSQQLYDLYHSSYDSSTPRNLFATTQTAPWTREPEGMRSTLDLALSQATIPFSRQHLPYGIGRRPNPSRDSGNATSLTRQPSIRRAAVRQRASDFSDFASRRRSAQRSSTLHSPEFASTHMADDNQAFLSPPGVVAVPLPSDNMYDSSGSEPSRVRSTLFEPPEPETSRSMDASGGVANSWVARPLPPPTSLLSLSRNLRGESQAFPRLRRGGIRPPESMLSASSSSESLPSQRRGSSLSDIPRTLSNFEREFGVYLSDDATPGASSSVGGVNEGGSSQSREVASLPTPRSVSPAPATPLVADYVPIPPISESQSAPSLLQPTRPSEN